MSLRTTLRAAAFLPSALLAAGSAAGAGGECGPARPVVLHRGVVLVGPGGTGSVAATFETRGDGIRHLLVVGCRGHLGAGVGRCESPALEALTVTLNGVVVHDTTRGCHPRRRPIVLNPASGPVNTITLSAAGAPGARATVAVLAVRSRHGSGLPCNTPPLADAGPDRTLPLGSTATLDGSGSTDPDGDALTYAWSLDVRPAGSAAMLSDAGAVFPRFVVDVAGTYEARLVVNDGQADSAPDTVVVTTENSPPVADAGPDQSVRVGETATLDGSGSSDVDGDPLGFAWTLSSRPPGSAARLSDPAAVKTTLVPDAPGAYEVQLVVHDGGAASAPDTVVVTTVNSPPVADAGPDQGVPVGAHVRLDGSGSTDVDGDPLSYAWSLTSAPAGSAATLVHPTAVMPTFVVDLPGAYVAQLVVDDGELASDPDTVSVTTGNSAPVAEAGADQTVTAGEIASLDGTGSYDPDGDPLSFAWSLTVRPPGSTAALGDPTRPTPSFLADRPGTYVAQLVVGDGTLDSAPDTVTIDTTNSAPVADAGPDQVDVPLGSAVALDGSGSRDADGHPLDHSWSLLSRPPGSLAGLAGAATAAPELTPDVVGDYVAQLIVNDGFVDSEPDTVRVSTLNEPPVAIAGADQNVPAGATVQLDGSSSFDPEAMPLAYEWSLVSRPAGSAAALAGAASVAPTFVVDLAGVYLVELVVNDGVQPSAPDAVSVVADVPLVTVDASDPAASEVGAETGSFTLTRTGDLASALAVDVAVSGSATNGTDYVAIGGSVLFAAGRASAAVTVLPIDDTLVEGDETVTLELLGGSGYEVGAPSTAAVTIADQPAPVVTIAAGDAVATEAGDTGSLTVSRTGDVARPLIVGLAVDGTATSGVDYASLPATVTLPAGAASATLVVLPIDDAEPEAREGVLVAIRPSGEYVVGTPDTAAVTIADDDTLVSVVASDPVSAENGSRPGAFTLSRVGPPAEPLTVVYSVSGTAAPGADYLALSGSATFSAGAAETALAVEPLDDVLLEGPEQVVVTLRAGPGYKVGALDTAAVTIEDDERPAVSIVVADGTASEAGPDEGAFSISRTGPTNSPLTVFYAAAGSATQGLDYVALTGSVTIPAGSSDASVTVTPIDDRLAEGAENVVLTLGADSSYVVVTPGAAGLQIADDDLAQVTIQATDPDAHEGGPDTATFVVRRTGDTGTPLVVHLEDGGTASRFDYETLQLAVTVPAGASFVPLTLTPRADNLVEGPEALTLTILPRLEYVVGDPGAATATIGDDPAVLSVVASDGDASEADLDPGAFVVTRAGGDVASALTVHVDLSGTAVNAEDYAFLGGGPTIPAGQTSAVIAVTPLSDNLVEVPETVVLTLGASVGTTYLVGSPSSATVTIADDPPVVTVRAADPDAAEAGLDPGTLAFTRTGGNLAAALNVLYTRAGTATNGFDYSGLGGAVSLVAIPANQPSGNVIVVPLADNLVEGPETLIVTLASSSAYLIGSPDTAAVTIADDPPVVNVTAVDPDASESGPDPGVFNFTRSGGNLATSLSFNLTRGGTATNIVDYASILTSLSFPGGQAAVTVTVNPVDDAVAEGPETVVLSVNPSASVVVGPSSAATVTIADDE